MDSDLAKIALFLDKHHVLSLATTDLNDLSVCSLFYAYSKDKNTFVVASSDDTTHIKHIKQHSNVAGNILLETQTVGKIQGVQFRAVICPIEDEDLKKLYFKTFPYALALSPKLWQIKVHYFKMTDNKFGFGKKVIWKESSF